MRRYVGYAERERREQPEGRPGDATSGARADRSERGNEVRKFSKKNPGASVQFFRRHYVRARRLRAAATSASCVSSLSFAATSSSSWVFNSASPRDRKSTRLNSSHVKISYAV